MKSEVINNVETTKYPCLMQFEDMIVLFHQSNSGVVVNENEKYSIGYYSNDWIISNFTKFQGSVILKND